MGGVTESLYNATLVLTYNCDIPLATRQEIDGPWKKPYQFEVESLFRRTIAPPPSSSSANGVSKSTSGVSGWWVALFSLLFLVAGAIFGFVCGRDGGMCGDGK